MLLSDINSIFAIDNDYRLLRFFKDRSSSNTKEKMPGISMREVGCGRGTVENP